MAPQADGATWTEHAPDARRAQALVSTPPIAGGSSCWRWRSRRRGSPPSLMSEVLPYHGQQPLEIAILVLFAILFTWVSLGLLDRARGLLRADRGAAIATRISRSAAGDAPIARRGPHRDRDADLQRGRARACSPACARRTSRWRAAGELDALRFLRAERHERSRHPRRRGRRVGMRCAATSAASAASSTAGATHRIKRKSGNIADFCRRWGSALPLHDRARRRQRDERRMPRDAGAPRRSQSGRRHHPDRAARRGPRHPVRAHAAVRHARVRPAVHRRPALLAARRIALLGPQRDHPRRAVHRALRAGAAARQGRAVGRDPVARFRRGRADAPRRLGRVDRLRPARQLRGDAAQPDRRAEARPPLVPGQPDELPALPDARACIRRIARCS